MPFVNPDRITVDVTGVADTQNGTPAILGTADGIKREMVYVAVAHHMLVLPAW